MVIVWLDVIAAVGVCVCVPVVVKEGVRLADPVREGVPVANALTVLN